VQHPTALGSARGWCEVAVSPAQKSEVKHRVSMLVALRSAPDRGDDLRPGRVRHGTPGERVSGAHRLLVRLAHAGREVLQMHVLAVTACSRSATARRCQGTRYATGSSAPRGEQALQPRATSTSFATRSARTSRCGALRRRRSRISLGTSTGRRRCVTCTYRRASASARSDCSTAGELTAQ
jgi:hypothetical protein